MRLLFNFLKSKSKVILILIFLLALVLRVLAAKPGYPLTHPDESTVGDSALRILLQGNFKPAAYYYGALLGILYAAIDYVILLPIFSIVYVPIDFIGIFSGKSGIFDCLTLPQNIRFTCLLAKTENFYNYFGRYDTAILGAITVILIYFLGKKLFNKNTGLLAAFLTAVNYRLVLSSSFSLADAPAALFAILSVILSYRLIKDRSIKNYILVGFGLALALSVKYFFYVIPPFIICHAMGSWNTGSKTFLKKLFLVLFSPKLAITILTTIATFIIINPFLVFFDRERAIHEFTFTRTYYGIPQITFFSISNQILHNKIYLYPIYYYLKYGFGYILSSLIVAGFVYSLIRYFKKTIIISSLIIPFCYFFLILTRSSAVRNYSAIIPFLLLFPAIIVNDTVNKLIPKKLSTIVLTILTLTIGFSSMKNSYLSSYYFSKPRNQDVLMEWLDTHLPDKVLVVNTLATKLPSSKPLSNLYWRPIASNYLSMYDLKKNNVDWVIISSDSTNYINESIWRSDSFWVKQAIKDDTKLFHFLKDNYFNLLIKEFGYYRAEQFKKPYWQALDPAYFVTKIPKFWKPIFENLIGEYNFNNSQHLICSEKISSPQFDVKPNKWYTLTGKVYKTNISSEAEYKNGFYRMDVFSKENELLKTYVTQQMKQIAGTQELVAAGFTPIESSYIVISFQTDGCNYPEKYFPNEIKLFESNNIIEIDPKEYPYFNIDLTKTFIWMPPL